MLDTVQLCCHIENILRSPVRLCDGDGTVKTEAKIAQEDPVLCDPDFASTLLSMRKQDCPVMYQEFGYALYAVIPAGDTDTILLGPVCYEEHAAEASAKTAAAHNIRTSKTYRISRMPADIIFESILMLFHLNSHTQMSREELLIKNSDVNAGVEVAAKAYNIVYDHRENKTTHNSYTQEVNEQNAIREGNLEALWKSWEDVQEGLIGRLGRDDITHYRSLAIVVITLASRSAMEGGVLPEVAYSLADAYTVKVYYLTDPLEITNLYRTAEIQFTKLVSEAKSHRAQSRYVRKAREMVHNRLHQPLQVAEIADELGISRTYLSHIFLEEEGIKLSSYIAKEKIRVAQYHLSGTEESLDQIASTFGFSSQSHFGQAFKKYTGMTPGKYREIYQRKE